VRGDLCSHGFKVAFDDDRGLQMTNRVGAKPPAIGVTVILGVFGMAATIACIVTAHMRPGIEIGATYTQCPGSLFDTPLANDPCSLSDYLVPFGVTIFFGLVAAGTLFLSIRGVIRAIDWNNPS
jgi:hypothetical protein